MYAAFPLIYRQGRTRAGSRPSSMARTQVTARPVPLHADRSGTWLWTMLWIARWTATFPGG